MLGTLLLALVLQDAGGATVTIGTAAAAPGEGATITATVEQADRVVFSVAGAKLRDFERKLRDTRTVTATVTAAANGGRHVVLQYGECRSELTDPTGTDVNALPLERRRFRVERRADGSTAVQGLDERNEPHEETDETTIAQATRDASELLLGGRLAPLLAGKPLAIGRPIDVPAELASAVLAGILDGVTIQRFTLVPKAPKSDDAPVELAAELLLEMRQGEELPVHTTFKLAGTIALARASGRLASLELSGPIESAGSAERRDGKVEVTGNGKLTWTVRVEPLAPR